MCMEQMVPELCWDSMCPAHSRCILKLAGDWGVPRYVSPTHADVSVTHAGLVTGATR